MQTAILHNTQCSGCKHILRRQQASSQSFTRARQPRKDQRTRLLGPQAVSSALALDIGSPSNFQAVTNIVSAVLLGAGAWWYLRSQVGRGCDITDSCALCNFGFCMGKLGCAVLPRNLLFVCRTIQKGRKSALNAEAAE